MAFSKIVAFAQFLNGLKGAVGEHLALGDERAVHVGQHGRYDGVRLREMVVHMDSIGKGCARSEVLGERDPESCDIAL
jgi:hypothetical protein